MKTFLILWFVGEAIAALITINRPRRVITPLWGIVFALGFAVLAVLIAVKL